MERNLDRTSSDSSCTQSEWDHDRIWNKDPDTSEQVAFDAKALQEDLHGDGRSADCSAAELAYGKDMQGIMWSNQTQSREQIRTSRMAAYENYLNLPEVVMDHFQEVRREAADLNRDGNFYYFESFRRDQHHNILHFQLRNLLWATSAFDFYFSSKNSIKRYNSLARRSTEVLCLESRDHPVSPSLPRDVLISTFCVQHGFLAVGGFSGELVIKKLIGGVLYGQPLTVSESGITNGLEIFDSGSGLRLVASNNDNMVRILEMDSFSQVGRHRVPWPANWATASPDNGKLLAVVGDDPEALVLDTATGATVAELNGHLDYSFAAAWHPNGTYLATANQDTTTRIWDMRMTNRSVHTLLGNMAAIRSLRYSSDGKYLAAAEAADFVHLYDVDAGYSVSQEIEMFSEICGMTFTPDDSYFMISLQEESFGGFLQFERPCGYVPM